MYVKFLLLLVILLGGSLNATEIECDNESYSNFTNGFEINDILKCAYANEIIPVSLPETIKTHWFSWVFWGPGGSWGGPREPR